MARQDHDQRMKLALEEFAAEFVALAEPPEWAGRIDASAPVWQPTELFLDPPQGERRVIDLAAEVRVQAGRGDGWVKLVGDWIDRGVGDLAPEWPRDVLEAAIAAAHAEGARVTAHTFGTDALPALIGAGIDCIEHGTGLTEELIGEMAARGTAVVPTLINVENFPGFAAAGEKKFPGYASTMRRLYANSGAVVRAAYEGGVPVFAGTDAGGGIDHGVIADEIRALCSAGMPAEAALAAGSWQAREWLGLRGIEEGATADFVVLDADPRQDLSALARPAAVVLRGRVYA